MDEKIQHATTRTTATTAVRLGRSGARDADATAQRILRTNTSLLLPWLRELWASNVELTVYGASVYFSSLCS
jgi:hypothetical protein